MDTNSGFPKSFSLKMIFKNHLTEDDSSLLLTSSLSIHTYLNMAIAPFSLYSWLFNCSRKVIRSSFRAHKTCSSEKGKFVLSETYQCPIHMCLVETRTQGTLLIQALKMIPQILYSNHLYNTNKYITSDPEILVKYYGGKVCNCEIKKRCDYLVLQSLYNYH